MREITGLKNECCTLVQHGLRMCNYSVMAQTMDYIHGTKSVKGLANFLLIMPDVNIMQWECLQQFKI